MLKRGILVFSISILSSLILCVAYVSADEINLKDGSIIRGKIIEIKNNESYRILTKDGSEIVYPTNKVESIKFTDLSKEMDSEPVEQKESNLEKPIQQEDENKDEKVESWGVVKTDETLLGSSQYSSENIYVKDFSLGLGFGKYGLVGVSSLLRPSDNFGIELGAGAYYYAVTYEYWGYYGYYEEEESGFTGAYGIEPHIYFTSKNQPVQHSLNFGIYHSEAYGTAYGVSYGYERHNKNGVGWDFRVGFVAAPDFEESVKEFLDIEEYEIDAIWIPVLLEIGILF